MEKITTPEMSEVSDKEVTDALRSKGVDDPEVFQLLLSWTRQGEMKVAESQHIRGCHRIQ